MSEQKEPISRKEMEKRKAEITVFHKDQISFLETQLVYEDLLTRIEESRLRRAVAMIRHAQMLAPDEPDTTDPENPPIVSTEGATKESVMTATRTLKKE